MTLIAALKINGVPFILADMLITDDAPAATPQFMPLTPNRTPPSGRAATGAVSKLLVLNRRLAIAFSGDIAAGTKLFADLHRRFSNSTPSIEALTSALKSWNVDTIISKRAWVVGWLANPKPLCFQWTARPGATVNLVTHAIQGSGGFHFEQQILPAAKRSGSGDLTEVEHAEFFAITTANKVLVDEMMSGGGLANYYGYALEMVRWKETAFEFQTKMVSVFMDAIINDDGTISTRPVAIRIYERHPRYALIETCNFYEHKGPDGTLGNHVFVELISPLHDKYDGVPWDHQLLDPSSPIYTFNIAARNAASTKSGMIHLTLGPDEVQLVGDSKNFNISISDQHAINEIRNSLN
jgi:hypothetical protein